MGLINLLLTICYPIWIFLSSFIIVVYSTIETIVDLMSEHERQFDSEVILIVGGCRGVGQDLAIEFGRKKSIVVLWDHDEPVLEQTAELIRLVGGKAHAFKCDISNKDNIKQTAQLVRSQVGDVQVVIVCSVVMPTKPLQSHSEDEIQKVIDVNIAAPIWIAHEFLPDIILRTVGNIVFLNSIAGKIGLPYAAPYCASRFAITGLAESLREEINHLLFAHRIVVSQAFPILKENLPESMKACCTLLNPAVSREDAAKIILDGLEKNKELIFIPRIHQYLYHFLPLMSARVRNYFSKYLDSVMGCYIADAPDRGFFAGD